MSCKSLDNGDMSLPNVENAHCHAGAPHTQQFGVGEDLLATLEHIMCGSGCLKSEQPGLSFDA